MTEIELEIQRMNIRRILIEETIRDICKEFGYTLAGIHVQDDFDGRILWTRDPDGSAIAFTIGKAIVLEMPEWLVREAFSKIMTHIVYGKILKGSEELKKWSREHRSTPTPAIG